MPTNLNALLRYKTIDECLSNSLLECSVEVLISKCNSILAEQQSSETSVSERTIRNDIRILRSDALGFNAPIIVKNGIYSYETPNFSIFQRPVKEMELLLDVQTLLVEEFDNIENKNLSYLLIELSKLTNEKIPEKCIPPGYNIFESETAGAKVIINHYEQNLKDQIRKDYHYKSYAKKKFFFFKTQQKPELPKWQFIFDAIL